MSKELNTPFIINVSGDPVAGKSSSIKILMEHYKKEGFYCTNNINEDFLQYEKVVVNIGAGHLFRELANNAGRSLDELRNLAKEHYTIRSMVATSSNKDFFNNLSDDTLDKTIDTFIDESMVTSIYQASKNCSKCRESIIIADARIAGLLMRQQNRPCMKVRMAIQHEIAAERLIKDAQNRPGELNTNTNSLFNEALSSVISRSNEDRARFITTYSKNINDQTENAKFDIQNLDNYDLVINTSGVSLETVGKVLYSCIENARHGIAYEKFWRSTKYIYPGAVTIENVSPNSEPKIGAIKINGQYYALKGQEYVGIGNNNGYRTEIEKGDESGYPLVPVSIVAEDQQFLFETKPNGKIKGTTVEQYIKNTINLEFVRNFEKKYGFSYPKHGVVPLKSGIYPRNDGMDR